MDINMDKLNEWRMENEDINTYELLKSESSPRKLSLVLKISNWFRQKKKQKLLLKNAKIRMPSEICLMMDRTNI